MADRPIFTYQTRLAPASEQDALLGSYAHLYGRAQRSLFAARRADGARNDFKRDFQRRFGITARQFAALRIELDGKIESIKKRRPDLIAQAQARIKQARKVIERLEQRLSSSNDLHQKKRRLATLEARLADLQSDHAAGVARLCFGSRKLFRAQFALEANGYASHAEWKADWQAARRNQFFVLGSGDETAGNQSCQACVAEDGSLNLQLRLPDAFSSNGKYLILGGVRFAYGHDSIVAAVQSGKSVSTITSSGKPRMKRVGAALSYRFVRDENGWRVFVSVEAQPVRQVSHRLAGAIGLDINADHLAIAGTDRYGNLVAVKRIELPLYGKTSDQAKALIGNAAAAIAVRARAAGKPVVIEKLDFQKKKAELESVDAAQARMLASFSCNKIIASIEAACFRVGVEVIEVNPAYTCVIGAVNHAQQRGISVHQGAAYAIARRGLGLSERPAVRSAIVPVRNGGHVAFQLPERNRRKHVWSFWSSARTRLKAALAAHVRCGAHQLCPPPLPPYKPAEGASWTSTVQSRGANRHQHCLDDVLDDVPW